MAITTTDLKQMQRDIAMLKKKVAELEQRDNAKSRAPAGKRKTAVARKRRFETIRQAARRNALTEDEAMALVQSAQASNRPPMAHCP